MKTIPDTEIRLRLRRILAQHRLDMQTLQVIVASGTVRLSGALQVQGQPGEPVKRAIVEALENDIARIQGVRNAFYELKNWRRNGPGEWVEVRPSRPVDAPKPTLTTT